MPPRRYEPTTLNLFGVNQLAPQVLEVGSFLWFLYQFGRQLVRYEDFEGVWEFEDSGQGGRPPTDPIVLTLMYLMQRHERVGDAEAERRARTDLRWKVVLGLDVEEPGPGEATLRRFRKRARTSGFLLTLHRRVLHLLFGIGEIERDGVVIQDSTPLIGWGSARDTWNLIADAIRQVLQGWLSRQGKVWKSRARKRGYERYTERNFKGQVTIDWSDRSARDQVLQELVSDARRLLEEVNQELTPEELCERPELKAALELLELILSQNIEECVGSEQEGHGDRDGELAEEIQDPAPQPSSDVPLLEGGKKETQTTSATQTGCVDESDEPDEDGNGTRVRIKKGVARDRIVSATDPEQRYGHKSQSRYWTGYKGHVSVSETGYVLTTETTPANRSDGQASLGMLKKLILLGFTLKVLIGDCAYGVGWLRALATKMGIVVWADIPRTPQGKYFPKQAFAVDLEALTVTCPAGVVSSDWRWVSDNAARSRPGATGDECFQLFRMPKESCSTCYLRSKCTGSKMGYRTVSVHPHEALLKEAKARAKTPEARHMKAKRQVVERVIGHLTKNGGRQICSRGLGAACAQWEEQALTYNLSHLASRLAQDPQLLARFREVLGTQGPWALLIFLPLLRCLVGRTQPAVQRALAGE